MRNELEVADCPDPHPRPLRSLVHCERINLCSEVNNKNTKTSLPLPCPFIRACRHKRIAMCRNIYNLLPNCFSWLLPVSPLRYNTRSTLKFHGLSLVMMLPIFHFSPHYWCFSFLFCCNRA